MKPKELTAETNFDEEKLQLRCLELRRARICSKLLDRAQRTPMKSRKWFCLSEIADECSRLPDHPEIDQARRAAVIDLLRASVLQGDFEDSQTSTHGARSRLAFLHTSPHAKFRFEQSWAQNIDQWKAWTRFSPTEWNPWSPPTQWPVTIWIRRDDCVAWFAKHNLPAPNGWGFELISNTPQTAPPKGRTGAKDKYDWDDIKQFVFKEMNGRGDFGDPGNQVDGWRSLADLVQLVRDYMDRLEARKYPLTNKTDVSNSRRPKPDHSPANSTLYRRIGPMVTNWRELQKSSDN